MSLREEIQGHAGTLKQKTAEAMAPTCRPCRDGDHGRCPSVLAENGIIDSTYRCPCYHGDPERHDDSFSENQAAWEDHLFDAPEWTI